VVFVVVKADSFTTKKVTHALKKLSVHQENT
jgi:hypothetical protein